MTHIDPGAEQPDPNAPPQNPPGNGAPAEADAKATEAFARRLGWRPEAEFSGAPASRRPKSFLSAADYIAKVEQEVPILRDRLRQQDQTIVGLTGKVDEFGRKVDEASSVIRSMHESQKSIREREYKRARADLEREMDAAARTGDPASYDQAKGKIVQLDADHAEPAPAAKVNGAEPPAAPAGQKIPEVDAWADQHPWFRQSVVLNQAAIEHEATLSRTIPLTERLEMTSDWVEEKFAQAYPQHFPGYEPVPPPVPHQPPVPQTNQRRRAPPRVASPAGGHEQPQDGMTYETLTAEEKQHCDYLCREVKGFTKDDFLRDYKR